MTAAALAAAASVLLGGAVAGASPGLPAGSARSPEPAAPASFNGYTYIGDSTPARPGGNNLNGGLWHEVHVSR